MNVIDYDEKMKDAKNEMGIIILKIIKRRKLTTPKVTKILQIEKRERTDLMCGHLNDFSMYTLIQFLMRLNQNVTIDVTTRAVRGKKREGKLTVKVISSFLKKPKEKAAKVLRPPKTGKITRRKAIKAVKLVAKTKAKKKIIKRRKKK